MNLIKLLHDVWLPLASIALTIVGLIFGDNLYERFTGHSVFVFLQQTPAPILEPTRGLPASPASPVVIATATPNPWPTAVSNPLGQATSTSSVAFQVIADWGGTATNALVKVSIDNVYIGRVDGNGRLLYSTSLGTHSYYLYAEATLKDGTRYTGEGKGSIEVKANSEYLVRTASDAKVLMLAPK